MAENSAIEWTDHTINFWWGCVKATLADGSLSEACRNCYAETFSKRVGRAKWGPKQARWFPKWERIERDLRRWNARAAKTGVPERVFLNSMSDFFEDRRDLDEVRTKACALMAECTSLRFLVLTKRIAIVRDLVPSRWTEPDVPTRDGRVLLSGWPSHVWIGTTVEDQKSADERVPQLLRIPATVRFLSCEPLIGPVDLGRWVFNRELAISRVMYGPVAMNWEQADASILRVGIHWVIAGGESGHGARPSHPDWFRSLRDQCEAAGVPFLFKQWGAWASEDDIAAAGQATPTFDIGARRHTWDDGTAVLRVGKKAAGRMLDGCTWDEVPS